MSNGHDVSKLPKWAQSKIAGLEGDVKGWKEQAYSAGVEGDSPIYMERYGEKKVRLPEIAVVSYDIIVARDGLKETGGRLDIKHEGDHIEIWGVGKRMSDGIEIRPVSSNRINLSLAPW